MRERFHRCFTAETTLRYGVIICAVFCIVLVATTEARAAIYYVDCGTGSDANDGLSEARAWRSVDKVSAFQFQNGDYVRFKRGCTWENAWLKVSRSLTIAPYGEAPDPPHLTGAVHIRSWMRMPGSDIMSAGAAVAPGSHGPKEILIVYDERNNRFYDKVSALTALTTPGQFFHDAPARVLYVRPLAGTDPSRDFYVSSRNHIVEFQPGSVEQVVVEGVRLSFANEYAIGFWYQSSGARYGSLRVANCVFFGNANQAVHIGGTNTFRDVEILNNTITANGAEGVYIRYLSGPDQGREQGLVVTRMLRISGNTIGGNDFGWRAVGVNGWANGEGLDIKSGVFSGVIDHNTLFDLKGHYGIVVLSSNVIVEHNVVRNVYMPGATPEHGFGGIIIDPYENRGTAIVRNNVITMSNAHGIALGGAFAFRPRFEIYDNDITIAHPYSAFAFVGQNMANTVIRNNRTRGGLAGVAVLKPCCPPLNVEIRNNLIRDIMVPFVTAKNLSPGVRMTGNVFCMRGPVNPAHRQALPSNFIVSMAECERQPPAPQQLRMY
ncbi:MAG: right-handed parallel beta-helix repeat-containing protein [Nitrospira sp.]|nr:right-handed parallel beta-helix repeat-containing protein [Nitrospira sp.]MCP9462805.1 right-handed parallel beta-helix repeat-containing protein [Nitrospira sp.]